MASFGSTKNGGADIAARFAGAVRATAAGAGDATEKNGVWVNRVGFNWLKAVLNYNAVLAATKTLTLLANIQDADDAAGTNAADFGTPMLSTVAATGGSGGTTEYGVKEIDLDLTQAREYIRIQFTPDLNASGTDIVDLNAVFILGGHDGFNPVTGRVNAAEPLG